MLRISHFFYAASAIALIGASSIGYVTDAYAETTVQSVEKAQTAADHTAIAKRYTEEAANYEKQAAEHERLAAKYRAMTSNPSSNSYVTPYANKLATHCENQTKRMKEAAVEAREMAQLHDVVAKLTSEKTK